MKFVDGPGIIFSMLENIVHDDRVRNVFPLDFKDSQRFDGAILRWIGSSDFKGTAMRLKSAYVISTIGCELVEQSIATADVVDYGTCRQFSRRQPPKGDVVFGSCVIVIFTKTVIGCRVFVVDIHAAVRAR